jgi:uncharacterized protein
MRAPAPAVAAIVLLALAPTPHALAETPIPTPPTSFVTDRASFLSPDAAARLSDRLARYERASGHQVIVYVDHTTGGVPIEDWTARAFQKWRVGRSGLDDGAALLVFADDRRVRIEVGYGLEARVPDALAGRIINDAIVPRLRAWDRDGAVTAGVEGLLAAIGDAGGAGQPGPPPVPVPLWLWVLGCLVLAVVLGGLVTHPALAAWLLINIGSNRRGGGLGGGGFSGGGFSGGGFSGGGGRSGGGGASGSW